MADIYEIAVQAVVDKSSQSRIQNSLTNIAKNVTLTVGAKLDENSLLASARNVAGLVKQEFVFRAGIDSAPIFETVKQLQDYARTAHIQFSGATINIDQSKLVEQVRQSMESARYVLASLDMKGASDTWAKDFAENLRTAIDQVSTEQSEALSERLSHAVSSGITAQKPPPVEVEIKTEGQPELQQLKTTIEDVNEATQDNTEAEEENTDAKEANAAATTGMIGRLAAYAFSMQHVIRFLREMVNITIELNAAMTQLKIVTQATDEQYAQYASNIARTAKEIGIATKDLIDASTVYARLGYTLSDSSTLAKYTGMLQNVGDIEASTAQSAITSIVKAFDVDINDIETVMDKLVIVGNNFPISVSQIAEGMMNASSSLHAAGNSLDQSIALLTAANTTTQNIAKASTAVRTISARLRNTKAELDELGEEVLTTAKYQQLVDMITKHGVSVVDQSGNLRSTYDVLKDIAAIWGQIGINERAALATEIAGVRQQNVFYSILEQFQEAEKAMESMSSSAGTLDKAYAIYMESVTAHINQFKAAWQALSQTVIDSGLLTKIIDIGAALVKLVDGLIRTAKELKIFGPLMATIPLASILTHLEGIGKFLGGTALVKGIVNLKNLINTIRGVEGAVTALGGLAGGISGVLTAISLIATAIVAIKAIRDKWTVTLDERVEQVNEASSEVAELENRLIGVRDRIAEIRAMDDISITDAEELATLQAEETMLESQLTIKRELLQIEKDLARYQALADSDKYDAENSVLDQHLAKYREELKYQETLQSHYHESVAAAEEALEYARQQRNAYDDYVAKYGSAPDEITTGIQYFSDYEIKRREKAVEDIQRLNNDAAKNTGQQVIDAARELSADYREVERIIESLDPTKDVAEIHARRLDQATILNTLSRGGAFGEDYRLSGAASIFGELFNAETNKQIKEIVKDLDDGINAGEKIKSVFNGQNVQNIKNELNALGIDFDLGVFFSYIQTLRTIQEESKGAGEATDETRASLTALLESVRSVDSQLTQLKSTYDTIQEGFVNGSIDWGSIVGNSEFANAFGELDSYEEFMRVIMTMPDNLDACSDAYKALAKEALLSSEAAQAWTDQTKAAAEAILEEKGYIESTDLSLLIAQQDASARASEKLADATLDETIQMRDAAAAGTMERQALAELAFTKAAVNRAAISTVADIDQLYALAQAANATTQSLLALEAAKGAKEAQVAAADALLSGDITEYKVKLRQSTKGGQTAEQKLASAIQNIKFDYGSIFENYNTNVPLSPGGGGGGGSSAKDIEEYIASIDKYYAALKRLESAKLAMADANRRLDDTEDLNEKIRITKEIIDLYDVQADATAELIELRKQTIETEAEGLRALGFQIEYNNKTNEFYVANLAHINELVADSVGEYDSLEEATNALRKETEDLINSLDSLNKENQEGIETLHDLGQSAKEARQNIVDFYDEIVEKANDVVDGFQNVYKVLTDAAKEFAQTGFLSVDSLQSILDLGPKYLAMLVDENGQLVINEQNLQAVIAAKTQDMAAETALSYAKQVLLATERGEEDVLRNLTDATAASSAATWDLAFATVGLAKAIGTANGLSEEYYDNAVSYLTSMQSLTETAVNSIPQYYETLKSSYISQADALDQVLKLTQDMLKWENQQAIDALNKQKDAYGDIINQKKELLKLTKEEQDHEKDLAEKIAEIAKLQARIDQLSLDDSREAQAQKRKLEEELAKLQKGLTDDQAGYALDVQNDALDKQLEMYEDEKDDEIAALEDSLNSAEKLYQAALHELETDYNGTIERLKQWNYECGNTLQQSLLDAIDAATAALDRFGGSFKAALEGVDSYTNLGTNNTSGAATSASANDIISAMRRNSITWWTTPNVGIDELNAQQASLAKQYSQLSGDEIYKDANGTWHHANGDVLYSLSAAEKDQIAHSIVAKMKANSAAWAAASNTEKQRLSDETLELGKRFGWLTGKTPTRDGDGVWWLDGKRLYEIYHSGGIVGRSSFKQNEVMALLEKGEAVLDDEKQKAMYKAVDFVSTLAQKIGSAVDVSRLFGGVSPAAAGGAYASLFGRGAGVNGSLLGCNIERIDIVAPIQVVQKLDSEELKAHADMIGALSAQYIREGFTKRGVGANVTAL